MDLDAYFDAATRRPWIYGGGEGGFRGHDCCLWIANWMLAYSGVDPASDLRGTYATQAEAEARLEKAGGYMGMLHARVVDAGWKAVQDPMTGDIGIVSVPGRDGGHFEFPVIRRNSNWIAVDPRRMLRLPGDLHRVMTWRGCAA